ncbi:MAG: glycosyltransferase [Alphaproteobacteria bacterium]|nr:glycosyltransferase [Alphaproteobacteria bacterium]
MDDPLVSVIMTTYNGEKFVAGAVRSVLNQEFSDFELIIIDDASMDRTVEIIRQFDDPRIRLVRNEKKLGISGSRNRGLALARGKFIAPHDHDDISYPDRLAKEVKAMNADSSLVLVSGRIDILPKGGPAVPPLPVPTPIELAWSLFVGSIIQHSFIMIRRSVIIDNELDYRAKYHCAEDFDLYHRLSEIGSMRLLPDVLGAINEHGLNASIVRKQEMAENGRAFLRDRYNEYMGEDSVSDKDMEIIWCLMVEKSFCRHRGDLLRGGDIFRQMVDSFVERRELSPGDKSQIFAKASEVWWLAVATSSIVLGPAVIRYRNRYDNLSKYSVPAVSFAKAFIKSLVLPIFKRDIR